MRARYDAPHRIAFIPTSYFVQAMLYATEGVDSPDDFEKPMVGVASVW